MMAETKKWEYRVFSEGSFWSAPSEEQMEATLNELGQDGWEVISAFPSRNSSKVIFTARRPLTGTVRRQRSWPGD
jgi:hypothetical protein